MEKTFKAVQLTHNHRSLLQNIEVHVLIVRLETIFPINSLLACTSKDSRLSMSTENDRHKVFMHVYLIIDDRFFWIWGIQNSIRKIILVQSWQIGCLAPRWRPLAGIPAVTLLRDRHELNWIV